MSLLLKNKDFKTDPNPFCFHCVSMALFSDSIGVGRGGGVGAGGQ